jgi:tetratricopeptide (TPR) repeat protein
VAKATATAPLTRKAEAALRDRRPGDALALARQFAEQNPGPDAQSLLQRCYLAAAEVHGERGDFRDAHSVLSEAERLLSTDPDWWERLAELRADLGDHTRALQLLDNAPGSTARPRVLGRVVDRAMRDEAAGRALVPADLQPQFDLIRKAFAEYEAGRDAAAREILNGIGLSSPFLEWKLLLRGLIAWSANDTPRALENWSRLSPDRLPARLAAPFRVSIDKVYAARLPADRLAVATRLADRLSGSLGEGLRRLRKQLASEETIPDALETARAVLPDLRRAAPDLVHRLANVVYWALVAGGQPEDLPRYSRIFGPPPDDPQFFRLQALVTEQLRRLDMAHGMWRKYEEWIAKTPSRWPAPVAARARALVLERMGRLARDWLADDGPDDFDQFDEFMAFFNPDVSVRRPAPKPLSPPAEVCFRRASELAPDWVVPATQLLHEYESQPGKALAAADDLLRRFPTNLDILEAVAELFEKVGDTARAHDCLKRALATNPLDRRLRQQAAALALNDARRKAEAEEFDAARAALREAKDFGDTSNSAAVLALATAIEIRAGDRDAAARHQECLMALPDVRVAGPYRLTVEGSRLKLKKKDLGPHQTAFSEALAGPANAGEFAALLNALDQYRREPVPYRGLKTHEKKILDRVMSAVSSPGLSEDDLVRLGLALHGFQMWNRLRVLGEQGILGHPDNAFFQFFQAEAIVARQRADYVNYRAGTMYCRVKFLMEQQQDPRYNRLQELLDERVRATPDVERWLDADWRWRL